MSKKAVKKHREPFVHIAKRDDIAGWKAWLIRLAAIVIGVLLMSAVLTALASSGAFLPRPPSGGSARPPERKAE